MALCATIFSTPLKSFVRFNKDHENTDMSSTEISNLVGKRSSFTDSCREFLDGATTFHLVK
jgi:hypothetical protein